MKTRAIVGFLGIICFLSTLDMCISMAGEPVYPSKPIELICSMSPGGGIDLCSRMLAENSKGYLGQEIIVGNKPGGLGVVGYTLISKAKPDGYMLGAVGDEGVTARPLQEKLSYGIEDFTYIIQFGHGVFGWVVLADSPFLTFKDVIEFARANPYKLTVANQGPGDFNQMILEEIGRIENIKMTFVPFNGAAPSVTALLGGHVMMATVAENGWVSYYKAKKVRLLVTPSAARLENYPDTPTLIELGYPPDFVFQLVHMILGPKNIEKPIVNKLMDSFKKGMQSPGYIKLATELGMLLKTPLSGDELKEEISRISKRKEVFLKKTGQIGR